MQVAERKILKYVQRKSFPEEMEILKSKEIDNEKICIQPQSRTKLIKKSSAIYKLDPRLVDGLFLVGGWLRSASIQESAEHQVILPKDNHVSDLIIQYYHLASGHSGREHVLSLLRERFWVIRANSAVRRLLSTKVNPAAKVFKYFENSWESETNKWSFESKDCITALWEMKRPF